MMTNDLQTTTFERTQAGLRLNVCAECDRRPVEGGGVTEPRACERGCAVFVLLPRLCDLVERYRPEPPCGYGLAVRSLLRHAVESRVIPPAPGDRSADDAAVPLARHTDATMAVIERVLSGQPVVG